MVGGTPCPRHIVDSEELHPVRQPVVPEIVLYPLSVARERVRICEEQKKGIDGMMLGVLG